MTKLFSLQEGRAAGSPAALTGIHVSYIIAGKLNFRSLLPA
jgi:hypothetical protein